MSQAYRLLSQGMPAAQGSGTAVFPADIRRTRQWVEALPRANARATQLSLTQALANLGRQKLSGSLRLSVIEELRTAIAESIGLLKIEYAGSALPLTAAKAAAAQQVESFHMALAHAYRLAAVELCAPAGNIPMLRSASVALALARSTWHYSQALAVAWRVYRAPAAGVWQGLHRVHQIAREYRIDTRHTEDPIAGGFVEIRSSYLQSLLMAITHPLAFSQVEQDTLWRSTRDFATHCALLTSAPKADTPVVPEDADRGPGPGLPGEPPRQWLDLRPFSAEVDAALARQRDGFSDLTPMRGSGSRVSVEMLQRLSRSFGLAAARKHRRMGGGHGLRSVFGLSSLHFYLAGQRDFESFLRQSSQHAMHGPERAAWARSSTDASRVPVHEARVLDQSLGGYRMTWDHAEQIRARVGELVGLTMADADEVPEWMIGVIRWLRYEANGGLTAGIELISRRAHAVGLRVRDRDGLVKDPVRALEMEALKEGGQISFLAPNNMDCAATRIEVLRAEDGTGAPELEQLLAGVDILLNAGDYALLRPLHVDLVAEAENGVA